MDMPGESTHTDDIQEPAESLHGLNREVYFPTLIYYRDVKDADVLNPRLLSAIRAEEEADAEGIERSNVRDAGGWHSQNDLNERDVFKPLVDRILFTGRDISTNLGYHPDYELVIDNMWAIINRKGSYNKSHIHPGCLWSGVYYVQAPENAGRISFTEPRTEQLILSARYAPEVQRVKECWTEVFYQPRAGRLLFFPSWLYHSVEANMSTGDGDASDRIILSFNMIQRRRKDASD